MRRPATGPSWQDVKWQDGGCRTDALLSRTVFYKVGHHASHNATLVEAFEKMSILISWR